MPLNGIRESCIHAITGKDALDGWTVGRYTGSLGGHWGLDRIHRANGETERVKWADGMDGEYTEWLHPTILTGTGQW